MADDFATKAKQDFFNWVEFAFKNEFLEPWILAQIAEYWLETAYGIKPNKK